MNKTTTANMFRAHRPGSVEGNRPRDIPANTITGTNVYVEKVN